MNELVFSVFFCLQWFCERTFALLKQFKDALNALRPTARFVVDEIIHLALQGLVALLYKKKSQIKYRYILKINWIAGPHSSPCKTSKMCGIDAMVASILWPCGSTADCIHDRESISHDMYDHHIAHMYPAQDAIRTIIRTSKTSSLGILVSTYTQFLRTFAAMSIPACHAVIMDTINPSEWRLINFIRSIAAIAVRNTSKMTRTHQYGHLRMPTSVRRAAWKTIWISNFLLSKHSQAPRGLPNRYCRRRSLTARGRYVAWGRRRCRRLGRAIIGTLAALAIIIRINFQ